MCPQELLRDGALRDRTQVFQEGSLLKVNIHAVTEAVMTFALKSVLVQAEGVLGCATALLEAREGHKAHLLGETERTE